ncbi:hypothetical protein EV363DRAFT_390575 [Boletus edulis]|nr:hypothetical protein EV363DRAFT_390575 [Boletus edulis]
MEIIEKIPVTETEQWDTKPTSKPKSAWRWNWKVTPKAVESQASDLEKDGSVKKEPRLVRLYAPIYCGLAVGLSTFFIGSGVSVVLAQLGPGSTVP